MKERQMIRRLKAGGEICTLLIAVMILSGCYKDKGNYIYQTPHAPVVTMDSVYTVFVGDSLVIIPGVDLPGVSDTSLSYSWVIQVPPVHPGDTDLHFTGKDLRLLYGLGPNRFTGRFIVENRTNDMKYFRDFTIVGKTAFSKGITVLSREDDHSVLSFIKPNDSIQPYIFTAVNPGMELPGNPTQILAVPIAYRPPIASYWVFGTSGTATGIQIDANDFRVIRTLADNFFDAPDTVLQPQKLFVNPLGVISGVINGVLYNGTTSTWNEAPSYGMFGGGATGNYALSPEMVFNYTGTFGPGNYIGFEKNRQQFVRFNLYGDATYFGTDYEVKGDAFNPKNVGMELLHLQQINGGLCYGFFRAPNDSLYECRMNTSFNGPFEISELGKRAFAHPELISATTKWQATANEIIYFSYQDRIYRYNPTNQNFKVLETNFQGKQVSMLKLKDQQTLMVGTAGSLSFLDIGTGKNGQLLKRIEGLPGTIIDVAIREE